MIERASNGGGVHRESADILPPFAGTPTAGAPRLAPAELDHLVIFDTTLRDGEQSPGAALTVEQKIAVAQQLARLNVDVIEAGFPCSSPGDFAAVKAIAERVGGPAAESTGPVICGLARIWPVDDIRACAEAIAPAARRRIHTFVGTSPLHRATLSWAKGPADVLRRAVEAVELARTFTDDVEFSPMDASRTEPGFLAEVVGAAIEAGATTINLPDTVGFATPEEWGGLIAWLQDQVPMLREVVISVHCHDDLGMAVANSLAAVRNGARQIEGCINGIGERAGNAAIEEVLMAVKLHPEIYGVATSLDYGQIYATSRMVSQMTGMMVQPNKAVVGANAFAHASGIHQDGVLKDKRTFEIMEASEVGTDSRMVLGKLSGRHAFKVRLEELGYALGDEELRRAFARFKDLADRKKEVGDRDLEAIVADEARIATETFTLDLLEVVSGTAKAPTATVRIRFPDGTTREAVAEGGGPVDATYRAINQIVDVPNELREFRVQEVTAGIDAVGEVNVRVRRGPHLASGHGADTDILVASARAYLNALNKLVELGDERRSKPTDIAAPPQPVAAVAP
ncbi:MAG TPA: 2-isopropylmalate synthase [Candidatus Dormibacteraeota bacterium]|jgi:2-isopropylmalate synthase|nr:2-isopropylmalate synthase [Candidatus Dormibacteraeota bacterium]